MARSSKSAHKLLNCSEARFPVDWQLRYPSAVAEKPSASFYETGNSGIDNRTEVAPTLPPSDASVRLEAPSPALVSPRPSVDPHKITSDNAQSPVQMWTCGISPAVTTRHWTHQKCTLLLCLCEFSKLMRDEPFSKDLNQSSWTHNYSSNIDLGS